MRERGGRADEEQRSSRRKRDARAPLRHEGGRPWLSGQPALQRSGLNGRSVILQRLSAPEGLLPPPRRQQQLQLEALRPTKGSR